MPYLRGGYLSFYLAQHGKMKVPSIQYYAAEIILALEELRRLNVVYRDMKPENLIFNDEGHLVLTDFGICVRLRHKESSEELSTVADKIGTPQYMAPEQLRGDNYRFEIDYWALGLTIYEMATGKRLLQAHREVAAETQDFFDRNARMATSDESLQSLLVCMLQVDKEKRIGLNNIKEIMQHTFFTTIDWELFSELKQGPAPHVPDTTKVNCFQETTALDAFEDDPEDCKPPSESEQEVFQAFEYNCQRQDQWLEYWKETTENKSSSEKKRTISTLWSKPISLTSFAPPISDKVHCRLSKMDFEITKPVVLPIEEKS
jgi:serine/threonine protein kinase